MVAKVKGSGLFCANSRRETTGETKKSQWGWRKISACRFGAVAGCCGAVDELVFYARRFCSVFYAHFGGFPDFLGLAGFRSFSLGQTCERSGASAECRRHNRFAVVGDSRNHFGILLAQLVWRLDAAFSVAAFACRLCAGFLESSNVSFLPCLSCFYAAHFLAGRQGEKTVSFIKKLAR